MNIALPRRLTVDQFLAWAVRQPEGKYELVDGVVVMQQSQKWGHSKVKAEVPLCAMLSAADCLLCGSDGPTVRISSTRRFQFRRWCRAAAPGGGRVSDPVIVVEVLSPSTACMDETTA
jgi:Uma2 family endonuclease